MPKESGMVYKYFSELSNDELSKYDCRPDISGAQQFMSERGNVLGVSMPNVNDWVDQILRDGHPSTEKSRQSQKSAIIKLYDKNVNAFRLNEQITFIGVLEFKLPDSNQISSSSGQAPATDEDGQSFDQMAENFFSGGIPNEDKVP